jgi:hypothetical protein
MWQACDAGWILQVFYKSTTRGVGKLSVMRLEARSTRRPLLVQQSASDPAALQVRN